MVTRMLLLLTYQLSLRTDVLERREWECLCLWIPSMAAQRLSLTVV